MSPRAGLLSVVAIALLATAARADDAAAKAAQAWLAPVIAGGAATAPSKDEPLDYVVNADTKSCRKLPGVGRATDAKGVQKLATCLADTRKAIVAMPPANPENDDWKNGSPWQRVDAPADVAAGFPTKAQAKKIKATSKDAIVVSSSFTGEMEMMTVYVVVGADGAVRAVWMQITTLD